MFSRPDTHRRAMTALASAAGGAAPGALASLGLGSPALRREPAFLAALAAEAAASGDRDGARAALSAAIAGGFRDADDLLAAPVFAAYRDDPGFRALAALEPPPPPVPLAMSVEDGTAKVSAAVTTWNPGDGLLEARFDFPERPSRRAMLRRRAEEGAGGRLLATLVSRGAAAGLHGVLYDNRDRGHSRISADRHPTLTALAYDEAAQAAGVDYGLNDMIRFGAVTIGNSSTALKAGPRWRSLARLAMTRPGSMAALARLYASNHLYVYPEHEDHDARLGDIYPANMPYVLVSQGSSGSDGPLVEAALAIVAALRPDTARVLRERGLVAPLVQAVFRRALAGDGSDAAYLDGAAHPSAFRREDLTAERLERMVRLANEITTRTIPPSVSISVIAETETDLPGDPLAGGGERLFDTPAAAARVARGLVRDRRYLLSASATDIAGRPVLFRWRVLRGAGVSVSPLDPEGRTAEVLIPWQGLSPVPGRPDLVSSRVDVGVFADNGVALSAPAFFSVYFPQDQTRAYADDGRLLSVDYLTSARPGAYVDPLLSPIRPWRDLFHYDDAGALEGWTRFREGGAADFTREGHEILERDSLGRPARVRRVVYELRDKGRGDGRAVIVEVATDETLVYAYAGAGDRVGVAAPP